MFQLKGAIISLRDVLVKSGKLDPNIFDETIKLLKFLISRGVQPVIVGNHEWTIKGTDKNVIDMISEKVGSEIPFFQGGKDMPYKQYAGAMQFVLGQFSWQPQETVYVGSTDDDMKAARNGNLLFLNALWYAKNTKYGFFFASPKDIARFLDCCCLSLGDWHWAIEDGPLRVYSIAPLAEFSKRYPEAATYSSDARGALKLDKGNIPFWGRLMAARLYFSGIGSQANFVAPYPGHKPDSENMELTESIKIAAVSLRAQYLDDLIIRHTKAQKSQTARTSGIALDHANQLDTICLRRDPVRTGKQQKRYKKPPLRKNKTVLVVDDICTEGHSLEAARALIEATGANVICLTWLKTPGANHYKKITSVNPVIKKPYDVYQLTSATYDTINNDAGLRNMSASQELAAAFDRYQAWHWPTDL